MNDTEVTLWHGDCLERMAEMEDNSVDSIVCDPPYGLGKEPNPVEVMQGWIDKGYYEVKGKGFMGKEWDSFVPQPIIWKEALRVLKPGGHLLAFSGTRTVDWMAMSLRFAGFEIRDTICWAYSTGFPKSHNIGKSVDKIQGNEREVVFDESRAKRLKNQTGDYTSLNGLKTVKRNPNLSKGSSEWEGWGTALKPAIEPITLARKPLSESTIAKNVLKHGTGGINIDESRVELNGDYKSKANGRPSQTGLDDNYDPLEANKPDTQGRFPANLILSDCEEVKACFPETKPSKANIKSDNRMVSCAGNSLKLGKAGERNPDNSYTDQGSASRFFKSIIYQAKPSKKERNQGCDNPHPTIKPVALMEYLVNMITPKGGVCLDPFMGSGTTGMACKKLGFDFIGIEMDEEYFKIAKERINSHERPLLLR